MKKILFAMTLPALAAAAADTWYVDDDNYGKAGLDGRSVETAFGTVQDAMDNSQLNAGDTIVLMPGVYDKGGCMNTAKNNGTDNVQSNRVVVKKKNVTIRSSTGKAKDVHIVGRKSTADGNNHGIGAGAMRCLAVNYGVSGVVAVGITFRDGATDTTWRGGGLYGVSVANLTVIDCVVSNCAAARGGGGNSITAHSSLFTGNYASTGYGSALNQSSLANCLVVYNSTDSTQPLGYVNAAVNCTVARNGNSSAGLHAGSSNPPFPHIYNMLVFGHCGGGGVAGVEVHASLFDGNPTMGSSDEATLKGITPAEECVSPELDDWRPISTGHCAGRGLGEYLLNVPLPAGYTYHDMAGNEIDTNGTVAVGAFQEVVTPVAARMVFGSIFEVEGMKRDSWNGGGWINPLSWPVTYRFRSVTPTFSLYADGDFRHRHATYDGWTAFSPPADPTTTMTIKAQARTDAIYVDAAIGDDEYDGSAAEPVGGGSMVGPKKTLQAAANVVTQDYSVIYAAPGVYRDGGSYDGNASNRVWLGQVKHTGLIASGGPGTATIEGAPDPETGGLGDNAMRCLRMTTAYSFVQGFVLTGGHSPNSTNKDLDQYFAGGFYGEYGSSQVLDCCITNNTAGVCGAGYKCTVMRCRIVGNRANRAGVVRNSRLYRCYINGNISEGQQIEMFLMDSCTVGPSAKRADGSNCQSALYNCSAPIVNSLILVPKISNSSTHIRGTNNVFITGCGVLAEDITDCIVTNLAAVALDDEGRPVVGSNVGIDRADETLSDASQFGGTAKDISGAQGVMNGARDLGALEADWRPRYAEDIGGHCTVTAVSPEVCESAEGRVCLPDGSIEGTFGATARPARRSVGVNVTGTGVLSMYLNGELAASFTASGATQEHTFQMPAAGGTFSFAYEPGPGDTGGAEIVEFQRLLGTSIIFR